MLNDFQHTQFALARHLREPLHMPVLEGVHAVDVRACKQDMAAQLSAVLAPVFPVTKACLDDARWQHVLRMFLQASPSHAPWATALHRAFVAYVCVSPELQTFPAWLQDLVHFEGLQNAVRTTPVTWPTFEAQGDVMHHPVVLNPTHVEAVYEWSVYGMDAQHPRLDMQSTYVSVLRDEADAVHVFKSSVFRGQLLDLLGQGQTGAQALGALARWLSHPEPEVLVREGAQLVAQLRREGVVLGTLR